MINKKLRLKKLVYTILRIYIILFIIVYIFQTKFIFHPSAQIIKTPAQMQMNYDEVRLTPDPTKPTEKVYGWFISSKQNLGTILFCHGNAYNISTYLDNIEIFHDLGYNSFTYDYRGFGLSNGEITEDNIYQDSMAAWKYLTEIKKIPATKIIIHGTSLGGGVASWLGEKVQPAGLVLESTFTCLPDIAQDKIHIAPVKYLCRYKFDTINRLKNITVPILFIHSNDDKLIPVKHNELLYNTYQGPKKRVLISGTHNYGFFTSGAQYYKPLEEFYHNSLTVEK